MPSEDLEQYLGLFLAEAHEQLVVLEGSILALEGDLWAETIQEAFRAAHTLKGSSRAMGFQEVGDLTHAMEDLLSALRAGAANPSAELVDTLLQALDMLKVIVDQIAERGEASVDVTPMLASLRHVLRGATSATSPATNAPPEVSFPAWTASVDEAARQARRDCFNLYDVIVRFAPDAVMKSVRAMMALQALNTIGEVLATSPDEESIENETFESSIRVVCASQADPSAIEGALLQVSEITNVELHVINDMVAEENASASRDASTELVGDASQPRTVTRELGPSTQPESHRAPTAHPQTVRVDIARLDKLLNLVGELVIDQTRIGQLTGLVHGTSGGHTECEQLTSVTSHLGRIADELQDEIMRARMQPIENLLNRFPRMVRDLARKLGKEIEFHISGSETELDRSVVEAIADPLIHLLRNCVDHGIEPPHERLEAGKPVQGTISLRARHAESHVIIEVEDDGRGISAEAVRAKAVEKRLITAEEAAGLSEREALNLIFHPGLSTASQVTDLSGRGVGMDIVQSNLTKAGGVLDIHSVEGRGTVFTIRLPLTLAIMRGLLVRMGECQYAVPLGTVSEALNVPAYHLHQVNGRNVLVHREEVVPILPLDRLLEGLVANPVYAEDSSVLVVMVSASGNRIGLAVDHVIGEQEVVVKPLGQFIGAIQGLLGATILGDGSIALIIDVNGLLEMAMKDREIAHAA